MLSALIAAPPVHLGEPTPHVPKHAHGHQHAHAHGHSQERDHAHDHGPAEATPTHFLERNPCDAPNFSEVCACCQGAVDVDELVGLKAAAPHESVIQAHEHGHLRPRLPMGTTGWAMAAATAWATIPGLYFGVQNYEAAKTNVAALNSALTQLRKGAPKGGAKAALSAVVEQQELNRAAYAHTLRQSASMQRFISIFAGLLPLIGSMCMLGSVVVPLLGVVGSAFLLLYCASHICRYLSFEWPRVLQLQQSMRKVARPAAGPDNAELFLGLDASRKLLAGRATLYPTVAASFAVYGVGAAMLSASICVAPALLVPMGACALAAGLGAVLYLNNGPIKGAFGKNQDRLINRRALGSQKDILKRIGQVQREAVSLQEFAERVSKAPKVSNHRTLLLGLRIGRGVRLALSYGLTFGLADFGRNKALQRLREEELRALREPAKLLNGLAQRCDPEEPKTSPTDRMLYLLHERPEQVTHQLGALLDHFHARVALEGPSLP